MIELERLELILANCPHLTVGLVGDLFLDRYLEIEPGVKELSIETGLEAHQVGRVRNSPGALGTVMNNLAALGVGTLKPVTVIGDDGLGYDLMKKLACLPVDESHILRRPDQLTPTYTKPLRRRADGSWQELNRLDIRSRRPLSQETQTALCEHLREVFRSSAGLIVLDQVVEEDWGVIGRAVRELLVELSREDPAKLVLTDSRAHMGRFTSSVLKGNRSELLAAAGAADEAAADAQDEAAKWAADALCRRTRRPVFCTLGERGILVARPDAEVAVESGIPASGPVDIVGAGDSATSGIAISLLSGGDEIEAAGVANLAASITVEQLGCTGTASPEQMLTRRRELG
jgi:bifunctional ADP-heptose synthase (sugar kinase/adenylyltransferase)